VAGMLVLWKRLAPLSPRAPTYLAVTAALLTLYAVDPVALGQNTPFLFLAVCLGLEGTDRWSRAWPVAATWVVTIVFKLLPVLVAPVLLLHRRWKVIACSLAVFGGLTALAAVLSGPDIFTRYLEIASSVSAERTSNDVNGSFDVLLDRVAPALSSLDGWSVAAVVFRVALLAGLIWLLLRMKDGDTQWGFAFLMVLALSPLVLWGCHWACIGAVGVALASRPRPDRVMVLLPVVAAVTVPLNLVLYNDMNPVGMQFAFLAFSMAIVVWIDRQPAAPDVPAVAGADQI
jgi:hypothetical protein